MTIDTNKARQEVDLVQFLERRYGMKRNSSGRCSCGIHGQDSDPSMSVTGRGERRGTLGPNSFKCHACGAHGDIYEYVALRQGWDKRKDFQRIHEFITGEVEKLGPPPQREAAPAVPAKRDIDFVSPVPRRLEPGWRDAHDLTNVVSAKGTPWTPKNVGLVFEYRDRLGRLVCYTVRFKATEKNPNPGGAKPFRLVGSHWRMLGYQHGEVSPIFQADKLDKFPDATVIVVEGEKCARELQRLLEEAGTTKYVVVCWMGGANRVEDADWKELWDRNVILWPDFDHRKEDPQTGQLRPAVGQEAMDKLAQILRAHKPKSLRMVNLSVFTEQTKKSGYDVWDMLFEDKVPLPQVIQWMESRLDIIGMESGKQIITKKNWMPEGQDWPVYTEKSGPRKDDESNLKLLLENHPVFKDRFTYDVFEQECFIGDKLLDDYTLMELRHEITQLPGNLTPKMPTLERVVGALCVRSRVNRFAQQLLALSWDGTHRVKPESAVLSTGSKGLLVDYANCEDTPFTRIAGMRWLVGCVRRILEPPTSTRGYQHDGMLILEGDQGFRKTSFLRVLGSVFGREAYTELSDALGRNKDDIMKLKGKCIVELAELGSMRKSDLETFKAFISLKMDEYRAPYGKKPIKAPRMIVFAGTTNRDNYLTDPTGNRRIWPATVTAKIDTDKLEADLEQIWAEAVHLALTGERNWMEDEEEAWQVAAADSRAEVDAWTGLFLKALEQPAWRDKEGFDEEDVFKMIGIHNPTDWTPGATRRIATMLGQLGYQRKKGNASTPSYTVLWRKTRGYGQKRKLTPRE